MTRTISHFETWKRRSPTRTRKLRAGATLVEMSIVLGVLLFLMLGTLQIGISALRSNVVSDAARRLAREATVHGSMCEPERTLWGPTVATGNAADGSDFAATLSPVLPTINPSDVSYEVTWLDGDSEPDSRVQVHIILAESPVVPFLDWLVPNQFSATSTLRIAH